MAMHGKEVSWEMNIFNNLLLKFRTIDLYCLFKGRKVSKGKLILLLFTPNDHPWISERPRDKT